MRGVCTLWKRENATHWGPPIEAWLLGLASTPLHGTDITEEALMDGRSYSPRTTVGAVGSALRRPGVMEWRSQTPNRGRFPGSPRSSETPLRSLTGLFRKGVFNYESNSLCVTSTFSQHRVNQIHELCRFHSFMQALITGSDLGKTWHFVTSFQEHLPCTCRMLGIVGCPLCVWPPLCAGHS